MVLASCCVWVVAFTISPVFSAIVITPELDSAKNASVIIPVSSYPDTLLVELDGQSVTDMRNKEMVLITIAKVNPKQLQEIQQVASENGFGVLGSPMDFVINVSYQGRTQEISRFSQFVPREIEISQEDTSDSKSIRTNFFPYLYEYT